LFEVRSLSDPGTRHKKQKYSGAFGDCSTMIFNTRTDEIAYQPLHNDRGVQCSND
jgi:hypothetical protein